MSAPHPKPIKLPKYRKSGRNQACAAFNGRVHWLGDYGSPESHRMYRRLCAEYVANGCRLPSDDVADDPTVNDLVLAFWEHAVVYYGDGTTAGAANTEAGNYREALKPLVELYGDTRARDFGPRALAAVRQRMVDAGWARTNVNRQVSRIKAVFGWGVSQEMIPARVDQALRTLRGLRQWHCDARESAPVLPVSEERVNAVLDLLPGPVRAIVQLQALTGARGGELLKLRACDLDTAKMPWVYRPVQHKTAHLGHQRVICFGPKAREVLTPYLKPDPSAYCFSPADAEAERGERRREARETPMTPSHMRRAARCKRRKRRRPPGAYYDPHAYRRCIARACEVAFDMPDALRKPGKKPRGKGATAVALMAWKTAEAERRKAAREWRRANVWHPHQLRHKVATALNREYDLEVARAVLGHKTLRITDTYAKRDEKVVEDVMERVG